MTPAALVLMALLPGADPAPAHDVLLEVGSAPAVRMRLKIEFGGSPLAKFDADAKRVRDALKGKPGASALDNLMPEGSLLRAEALTAAAPHPAALSNAIFRALDKDKDGKLSAAELAHAEKVLLGKFDLDDDECISPLELVPDLQTVVPEKHPTPGAVRVTVVPVEGKADIEQTIKLGHGDSHWRGKIGGTWVEIHARPGLPAEKPAMPKALLVAGREEAKTAFEKIAPRVVSLTAVPGPVGLFDLLDADRDGQLSVAELRRAKTALADAVPTDTGVSLVIVPGIAKPPAVPLIRTFTREAGPQWFRAMDRNGDGFVSVREFLGTPEQFRKLDRDGDGLLSAEEAEKVAKP
ncbi:transaldolase/EF-hand domain-containing protein [Gemmata sp. SH-PL17]|uniref:EF-hand domain-containing protein n=1 Tax=Gemmata sp. SH-PL17 TaxID=1630693 RepID=UPI00078D4A81|nr:EF-hand domain-containing protein [Gemmata sp. SH-PL17]AMV29731.1 transaldolase/EF-hand domain-containing protein [Gemmata sp. SH-PL17]